MTVYISLIVEGETEVRCVESLLQRMWTKLFAASDRLQVLPASEASRSALASRKNPELESKVQEAFLKLVRRLNHDDGSRGLVLICLDADDDCPVELATDLLKRARAARADAPLACVLAKRMFENWIVAGASKLAGKHGFPDQMQMPKPGTYEDCNGANWIERQLRTRDPRRTYKKLIDAPIFIRAMGLAECLSNSRSFRKLHDELKKCVPAQSTEEQADGSLDANASHSD